VLKSLAWNLSWAMFSAEFIKSTPNRLDLSILKPRVREPLPLWTVELRRD
jgi:hypothetical protein